MVLYQNNDDTYGMIIAIYRLVELEGSAALDGDGFLLTGQIDDQPITLSFYPETYSYTPEVVESTWDELPLEQVFRGFMPLIKGVDNDIF